MATFSQTSVTDAAAHALLAEYFAYREQTFPTEDGYRTTFPEPEQFLEPDGVFLLVHSPAHGLGAAVGCGGIRRLADERFELKHLWVQPQAQGSGLGRALLAELELRAMHLGATSLVLDTNASLEAAGLLYRSLDYAQIAPYNDNPNATHWFEKNLVP